MNFIPEASVPLIPPTNTSTGLVPSLNVAFAISSETPIVFPIIPAMSAVRTTFVPVPAEAVTGELELLLMAAITTSAVLAAVQSVPEPRVAAANTLVAAVNVSVVGIIFPRVPPIKAVIIEALSAKAAAVAEAFAILSSVNYFW